MRTNTDCSVYNYYRNSATGLEEWRRTLLDAVHWESGSGIDVTRAGIAPGSYADALTTVYIPFGVSADGGQKTYLPPLEFAALDPDAAARHWTLAPGQDRLIMGEAPELAPGESPKALTGKYDNCVTVRSVAALNFGSAAMQHWEVVCT